MKTKKYIMGVRLTEEQNKTLEEITNKIGSKTDAVNFLLYLYEQYKLENFISLSSELMNSIKENSNNEDVNKYAEKVIKYGIAFDKMKGE
nr:hypothetical protein [uncultured Pseudogulbenkiania sp.]